MIDDNIIANDRSAQGFAEEAADAVDDSIGGRFTRLIESGRDYVDAELDRQKLRAGLVGTALRQVAILAGVAAMLLFATILALMVGLILALMDVVGGPAIATAIVISGALLVTVVLVLIAKAKITGLQEALKP